MHITLADVFAVDLEQSGMAAKLKTLCNELASVSIAVEGESVLGETSVMLFSESPNLLHLHTEIVSLLEASGAIFNNSGFTKSGFIGHASMQKNQYLDIGEKITIDSVSLVDMFPDGDWQQRKVLATCWLVK